MYRRKFIIAVLLIAFCGLAFTAAILILKSFKLAVVTYILGLGGIMLFAEPFTGLVNYLLFLYLRPQEFLTGFKGLPIMLMIGGASLIVAVVHMSLRRRFFVKYPQDYLMLWLLVAIVLSHLAHFYIAGAVESTSQFLSRVAMYFLFTTLVTTIPKLRITMVTLVILTLYQAGQGIYQYFSGSGIAGQSLIRERIQGVGTFGDPNVLAMTFLMVVPYLYFAFLERATFMRRAVILLATVIIVYALYLTNSRGGFLSFAFLGALLFSRRYGVRAGAIGGVALVLLILAFGPSRMHELSQHEESAYGRIEAWAAGMDMIQSNPIFGVGAMAYTDHFFREAHNSFVQVVAELGIFGAIPWLMLLVLSMKHLQFIRRNEDGRAPPELRLYADSIFYGMAGFAVGAFFISRAYADLMYILVGMAVAVMGIYTSSTGQRYVLIERRDFVQTIALMFGLLILLKVYLLFYW